MERRRVLGMLGAGLAGSALGRAAAEEPGALEAALERFAAVDWQRHAVMTKKPGEEPPWRLRLEAEGRAASAGAAAVPRLLPLARHASPHVRGLAAQALGVAGSPAAAEPLLALLRDSSSLVRCYAVEGISRLTNAAADGKLTAAVTEAAKDTSGNVRFSARQAALRLRRRVPAGAALQAHWGRGFDPAHLASAAEGKPAPGFSLPGHDGSPVRLADTRYRYSTVLLFQLADW